MNQLIDLLREQAEIYEELLGLAQAKKEHLVHHETESLREITERENALIGRFRRIEKKRSVIIQDQTMSGLIEDCGDDSERGVLVRLKNRMRAALDSLKPVNERNKELLEQNLAYTAFTMNIMREACGERSFFDARQ